MTVRASIESPTGRSDRWPILIVAAGWTTLAVAGLFGGAGPDALRPIVWIVLATIVAGGCLWVFVASTPQSRRFTMSVALVVAAARSAAYIDQGAWNALGVWMIVVGTSFSAYKLARDITLLRRHLAEARAELEIQAVIGDAA